VLLLENIADFPLSVSYFRALTGGQSYLDMCPFCSANDVAQKLASLGDRGRLVEAIFLSSIDLIIPLSAAAACYTGYRVLLPLSLNRRIRQVILAMPIVAMALDFTENATIEALLLTYPNISPELASAEGWLSGMKMMGNGLATMLLVGFGIARLFRKPPVRS
jgi:hypothetical protein